MSQSNEEMVCSEDRGEKKERRREEEAKNRPNFHEIFTWCAPL
jgi:hypothetical protein